MAIRESETLGFGMVWPHLPHFLMCRPRASVFGILGMDLLAPRREALAGPFVLQKGVCVRVVSMADFAVDGFFGVHG